MKLPIPTGIGATKPAAGPAPATQRNTRDGLTLEDLPTAIRKELSTKLVWAVYSTLHVGGYGHWSKLRKWADRVSEKIYDRRLDFLDFRR